MSDLCLLSSLLPICDLCRLPVPQLVHPGGVEPVGRQCRKHSVQRHSRGQRPLLPQVQQHHHQLLPARNPVWPPLHHHSVRIIGPVQQFEESAIQNNNRYTHHSPLVILVGILENC